MNAVDAKQSKTFKGRISDADPADIPHGAFQLLDNFECLSPGRLSVRKGKQPITFANGIIGQSAHTINALHRHVNVHDWILYANANGSIYAGRTPEGGASSPALTALATGRSTLVPNHFFSSHNGDVYWASGYNRGGRWDTYSVAADELGIDAPSAAPAVSTPVGGAATAGDYIVALRFVEFGPQYYEALFSNFSAQATVTAAANDQFQWGNNVAGTGTNFPARTQTRSGFWELLRSTVGQAISLFRIVRIGYGGTMSTLAVSAGPARYTVTTTVPHNLKNGTCILITGGAGTLTGNAATDFAVGARLLVTEASSTTFTVENGAADSTSGAPAGTVSGGASGAVTFTYRTVGYRPTQAGLGGDVHADSTIDTNTFANFLQADFNQDDGSPGEETRHTPPPNYMSVGERFQDRMLYGVPVDYTTGTVAVSASGTTVTGTGTFWTTEMANRLIWLNGDARPYRVSSVNVGAQTLVISEPHVGALSGVTHKIYIDPFYNDIVFFSEVGLPESVDPNSQVRIQTNIRDHDRMVGFIPLGHVMFCIKERHLYELTYYAQPVLDTNSGLKAFRGAFNHRCWAEFEGVAYLADQFGVYALNAAGNVQPLSGPLQDCFRDLSSDVSIDFSRKSAFHVTVDPTTAILKVWVCVAGDGGGTYPTKALCMNIRTLDWWTESTPHQIAAACWAEFQGRIRLLLGGQNDIIFMVDSIGLSEGDGIATAVRKTAVSSTDTTVVVAQAGFAGNEWKNVAIAIYHAATGEREVRRCTASSATSSGNVTITVDPSWTTNPTAAVDIVIVGGINATAKTKGYELVAGDKGEEGNKRGFRVSFSPTTNTCEFTVKRYLDYDTSAPTFRAPHSEGKGSRALEGYSWMEFDLKSTVRDSGTSRGSWLWRQAQWARKADGNWANQSVTFEFQVTQGLDVVVIDEMLVEGVVE